MELYWEIPRKKAFLLLRWVLIIVASYFALFSDRYVMHAGIKEFLIILFLLSNIALAYIPERMLDSRPFVYTIVIVDVLFISILIYLSGGMKTDFYIAYFFIMMLSAISGDLKNVFITSGIVSLMYGIIFYTLNPEIGILNPSYLMRVPFLFVCGIFYGIFVKQISLEESKIRSLEKKLEEGKRRWEMTFDAATDMIFIVDNEFNIIRANRMAAVFTERDVNTIIGMNIFELIFGSRERPEYNMFREKLIQGKGYTAEVDVKDTASIFRVTMLPLKDNHGIHGATFYIKDITEMKELEKKYFHHEKLKLLGKVSMNIAEDFKTVLNILEREFQAIEGALDQKKFSTVLFKIRNTLSYGRRIILELEEMGEKYGRRE